MKILFWILVALNLSDFWLTSNILKNGGYEANPLVNWFIEHFGVYGILYVKLPFLVIMGYIIYTSWDKLSPLFARIAEYGMFLAVGAYSLLFLWSLSLYAMILYK